MKLFRSLRTGALLAMLGALFSGSSALVAAVGDYNIAQSPLFLGANEAPLMMIVMSRDEQLFNKAYSDYTDLNADGVLDTTYQDAFSYAGYFDSKRCYTGGSSTTPFKATRAAAGTNLHTCGGSGEWSGNFLNWITMSRLDVLRYVLYGGQRQIDISTRTVLERASIPNDLHAWVKVYRGADIGNFAPLTGTQSFCNATVTSGGAPLMRAAAGNWSEWAATALSQCRVGYNSDTPATATDYTVRVEVCDPTSPAATRESFCVGYSASQKPTGLLQEYGESGKLRFGLISGSFSSPRSGGALRRNIGKLAGNGTGPGCASKDEINLSDGTFCNQGTGQEGIINTLSRFELTQWNYNNVWNDCNTYGILNRQGQAGAQGHLKNPGNSSGSQNCSGWGNPLSEMYAEALRYVTAAGSAGTTAFNTAGELAGLPVSLAWQDPYNLSIGGSSYCASCSILVLSSGLGSFDSDELPTTPLIDPVVATNAVGTYEGISGNYLVGRVVATQTDLAVGASVNTHEDLCTSKDVQGQLARVRGLCPDIPSMEGSYLISGMAFKARTTDLRPGLQGKPSSWYNTVQTYTVALAENLPKFEVPIGTGKIVLSPLCQANNNGGAVPSTTQWRSCFLGSVGVGAKVSSVSPNYTYGRPLKYDGLGKNVAGSFSLVWEDSLWGNDHDNDVVSMLTYCVGAACFDKTNTANATAVTDICWRADAATGSVCAGGVPSVASDEVLIRIENLSAYAGNAMLTGFGVTGSNDDGVKRVALRPGGTDNSILTNQANPPAAWSLPQVIKLRLGASGARQLENPLWLAAKYGGFKETTGGDGIPNNPLEWDANGDGSPDNYFLARDPGNLKQALSEILFKAAAGAGATGGGASGARLTASSYTIETGFNVPRASNDWTGSVIAYNVGNNGERGSQRWSAADRMPAPASRKIHTNIAPTTIRTADGAVTAASVTREFTAANLFEANSTLGDRWPRNFLGLGLRVPLNVAPQAAPVWMPPETNTSAPDQALVAYLRGDQTRELKSGGRFRNRSSIIGDIVNSSIESTSPLDDYGYARWERMTADSWMQPLGESYRLFVAANKAGTPKPTLYANANDGMLHAFDASATGGRERFAFIPSTSRERMGELANPTYAHWYTMDGPISVSHVPSTSTGGWRTLLTTSAGAGGRSVSALNVTDPDAFGNGSVLWELRGNGGGYTTGIDELGYVSGKVSIVPVAGAAGAGPRWVAIFGNGVNSVSGAPVLFVVDVNTGAVLRKLSPSSSSYANKNGLMSVSPVVQFNQKELVDVVYGGDMQGNVWRYDLSSSSPASWNVSLNQKPLFTATDPDGVGQPITGGLEIARGSGGSTFIYFGTGRYFVVGDNAAGGQIQSLYGIVDTCTIAGCVEANRINATRDSALVQQSLTVGTASGAYAIRNISQNGAGRRGWFMDLSIASARKGERFFGTPRIQNGIVFFTTYEPSGNECDPGGTNWLYGLSLTTGGGSMTGLSLSPGGTAVCTGNCGAASLGNGEKQAPVRDTSILLPSPAQRELSCPATDPACSAPGALDRELALRQCTLVLRTAGADPLYLPRPCGRQSWRQIR